MPTGKPSGIMCPLCRQQGIVESEMYHSIGKGGIYTCAVQNHPIEYSKLMSMKPTMRQLVITEKQPANTISQPVWMYPEVLQRFKERFPTNLMTTLCAIMTALADPDTILVEGDEARKLRELGVTHGRDIVGLVDTNKALKLQYDQVEAQLKQMEPMIKLVTALTGGQQHAGSSLISEFGQMAGTAGTTTIPRRASIVPISAESEPSEDELIMAQERMNAGVSPSYVTEGPPPGMPRPVPSGR